MDGHDRALLRAHRKVARSAAVRAREGRALDQSIDERNVSTTPEIPGADVDECLGLVSVTVARANSSLRDVATSWRDTFGGRMGFFGKLADEARAEALVELRAEARRRGADAIVGVRIDVTAPTTSVLVVTATGTAVRLVADDGAESEADAARPDECPDHHGMQ